MGIIDKELTRYFKPDPSEAEPYRRLYESKKSNGMTNGERTAPDAPEKVEKMDVDP